MFLRELLISNPNPAVVPNGEADLVVREDDEGNIVVSDGYGSEYSFSRSVAFALGMALVGKSARSTFNEVEKVVGEGVGVPVVLTGKFSTDRSSIEYELKESFFQVTNRVTKDSILVYGEVPEGGTDKMRYADRVGALKLSEAEMTALLLIYQTREMEEYNSSTLS
jgi:hypothetical protein